MYTPAQHRCALALSIQTKINLSDEKRDWTEGGIFSGQAAGCRLNEANVYADDQCCSTVHEQDEQEIRVSSVRELGSIPIHTKCENRAPPSGLLRKKLKF